MFSRHKPLPTLALCFADTNHYQHFSCVLQTQPITNTYPVFCRHNPLPTLSLRFADTAHYQHVPCVLQTQPITNTFPAFCRHSPLPTLSLRFADTAHYQHFPCVLQTQPITNPLTTSYSWSGLSIYGGYLVSVTCNSSVTPTQSATNTSCTTDEGGEFKSFLVLFFLAPGKALLD